ncbi:MAG: family metallopeptidase [Chitinophagaceae bacterium]|nr:family metallopeptidase [Chitinophagaceae bacterium]
MKRILYLVASTAIFITACTTNAVTGRKQLSLISESSLQQEAVTQYRTFLSQNKVITDASSRDAEMVRRVGSRIATAITQYYNSQGKKNVLDGYKWEFNLVDNKEVNAWCMPGGKVVVYTGLFTVAQNEAQLAIVLGHEITHAVAHHGQERISQAMLAQGIGIGGSIFTSGNPQASNVFNNIYGPAATVGVLLPNSRNQELEADHYGLIFAAMAGYNPQEAIPFWTRMANLATNTAKPPAFLSTHPADAQRIEKIKGYMKEALSYYKPVNSR